MAPNGDVVAEQALKFLREVRVKRKCANGGVRRKMAGVKMLRFDPLMKEGRIIQWLKNEGGHR